MPFRKAISTLVLVTLMLWTLSATAAPLPTMHGPACEKMLYRTMVVHHPAAHKCCPPETMILIVCYRMHGDEGCDSMRSCRPLQTDEAISGTAKYHDDGQARACATAHAVNLLMPQSEAISAPWVRAGLLPPRSVLEASSDLRI
ncbi:MAG TPA: hypothetical protein VGL89_13570 [Candidatus Koribacter sp.]|jgi:hypothetical protein